MTEEAIDALTGYVQAAMRSAVAEALQKDDWTHARLDRIEQELREILRTEGTP